MFIVICAHDYAGQVTSLVASMAAPACRSRQTTTFFPNLAALISSVSSLSCQNTKDNGEPKIKNHQTDNSKIYLFQLNLFIMAKELKLSNWSRVISRNKKSSLLRTPCFSSRSCEVQAVFVTNSVNTFQSSASIKLKTFFDAILSNELTTTFRSCDHENQCGRYNFHTNLR